MSNMKPWLVIQEIERDNGKLFKQAVIETEAFAGNDDFFEGLMLAFHPLDTFGVKQIPTSTVKSTDPQEANWSDFVALAKELSERNLTGHAARDAIHDMMLASGQEQWDDWYRRILLQYMNAGFTQSTVNKAVKKAKTPQYQIPVFTCMLAHDSKNHEKKVKGKKQIEVKLDGVRALTILYKNGDVKMTTRNGRELKNFSHITEQLKRMVPDIREDMLLDGEIMSSSFQDLMTQVQRKSDVAADDAVLNVFDILPLSEFLDGKSVLNQVERSAELTRMADDVYGDMLPLWFPNLNVLRSEVIDLDTDAGMDRYNELNKLALEGGYEGIMLKEIDGLYECKRSTNWLKLKPVITVDLTIVAIEEGTGKNVGKMGALICEGYEGDKLIKVNVGGGYSDQQRIDFFNNKLIGEVIEVKADVITKSRDGDDYSLRFPRFVRFRGLVGGEKI